VRERYSAVTNNMPFDVLAWLTSERVHEMNLEERGLYLTLLVHAWANRTNTIPSDPAALASIAREEVSRFSTLSKRVLTCWRVHPTLSGRLYNERLTEERERIEDAQILRDSENFANCPESRVQAEIPLNLGKSEENTPENQNPKPPKIPPEEDKGDTELFQVENSLENKSPRDDDLRIRDDKDSSTSSRTRDDPLETKTSRLTSATPRKISRSQVVDLWNNTVAPALGCPRITSLHDHRATKLRLRLKERPDLFDQILAEAPRLSAWARESRFLCFDWLILSPGNLAKFLEGNYRNKEEVKRAIQESKPSDVELEAEYLRQLEQRRRTECYQPRPLSQANRILIQQPERREGSV
jgi:uncharacterized protein YdaU (DUF1376 family)